MRTPAILTALALLGCGDKDGGGGGDGQVVNTAPSTPEIAFTPEEPISGETVTITIVTESVDAEGDEVTYSYKWWKDDIYQDDLIGDSIPGEETSKWQNWLVQVTPSDGELEGEPAEASIFIGNGIPTVSVTLSPSVVGTDDTITAEVEASDPDGEGLSKTYVWKVDDVVVEETGTTLDGLVYFDRDQTVVCEVTVEDGSYGSATGVSEPIVIANAPPGDPVIGINPSSPPEYSDLVCVVLEDAYDADGDELTYEMSWTVDGVPFTSTTQTTWPNDTVSADDTELEQVWECTAVVSDSADVGGSATASATITPWPGMLEFTTCGVTGATGPTQDDCDAEYADTLLDGYVTVSEGIQAWTVPFTAEFVITTYGAQGAGAATSNDGGKGAWVQGTFKLTEGDIVYIAVGQQGDGEDSGNNGAGGGGSFVVAEGDEPLIIAGGGAGTRTGATMNGCDGRADEYGGKGSSSSSSTCPAKSGSVGEGGAISSRSYGAAGGGFNSDGEDDYGQGGCSWFNGLCGGSPYATYPAEGGFGGGGSGNGYYGGGGGGGYSGGDGGYMAGGGGSYNDGADASWEAGINEGEGMVTIDLAE